MLLPSFIHLKQLSNYWHSLFYIILKIHDMSKIEKIAFIQSFWALFKVKGKLEICTEVQLDKMIKKIIDKVQYSDNVNALMQVHRMPIYLN